MNRTSNKIDFSKIRGETVEAQRSYFEQLVCHLARLDGGAGEFRRIEGAGGDGGVEAIRILPTNRKVGYQAKFYPERDKINWGNIYKSVETAVNQHPKLERYVIALPCDFTATRAAREGNSTEGVWGKWVAQAERWGALAAARGIQVKFEPWTAFELETALLKPDAQHLIRYFFDRLVFTREWMRQHLERTIHDLQARYSPEEHVDTEGLKPFDVIYRRENVRRDLRAVFEVARMSQPRAATSLVEVSAVAEADITAVEGAQRDFLALSDAIDVKVSEPWPVCDWFSSWYSFTRRLNSLHYSISNQIRSEQKLDEANLSEKLSEKTRLFELTMPEVFGRPWTYALPIDGARAVLFVGRAGAGKSHVLARGAQIAWDEGAPVVHLLGQHILDNDPRTSILGRLELGGWSFHDLLSALNLAAEMAQTRALLVIDALNEGRGTEVWRNHLASFIREVNRYERVVLVLSCREEYLRYVVFPEGIANPVPYPDVGSNPPQDCNPLGRLVRVAVHGFRTTEEREAALRQFMDRKGIARPTAPVLDQEFFNPLFITSVCRAMARAGVRVFPRGLHGAREVFTFALKTKAKALGTYHDGNPQVYNALSLALDGLAGIMVERKQNHVPISEAIDLIERAFKALPISGRTWLDVLESSDILRRDDERAPGAGGILSRPEEVIRFSFERLQDNLIAEHLVRSSGTDIEDVFAPGAPLEFLLRRRDRNDGTLLLKVSPQWVGVVGSLWAAVAEKYKKELWDLRSFGGPDVQIYWHEFRPVFHMSIRERESTAFTPRTKVIFDELWQDEQAKKLIILLSTSCVPGHTWNADFLAARLLSLPSTERDSAWSRWFEDERELIEQATEITDWALNVDVRNVDAEVIRLAGITLACLCTVSNLKVRNRATESLANLLAGSPELLSEIRNRFSVLDDPDFQNRLVTAGSSQSISP